MFFSETLLSKSGSLSRVWLAANLERKLSKTHILQCNLQDSVEAIVTPSQAPLALRLSGQLLLGVVRIYSRKARYLLDDCNEALLKIKMAFRSTGNNDIPENLAVPNREALMLPDKITPADNLNILPPPDADWLLTQLDSAVDTTPVSSQSQSTRSRGRLAREINLQEDFSNSQLLQGDIMDDDELALAPHEDLDLELDFGDDIEDRPRGDKSMELGREAPAEVMDDDDDLIEELEVAAPSKGPQEQDPSLNIGLGDDTVRIADEEGDIRMEDDFQFNIGDDSAMPDMSAMVPQPPERARISESPLSDIDENVMHEVEEWTRLNNTSIYDPGQEPEQPEPQPQRKSKAKRKVFGLDPTTQLTSAHIKDQQQNRANILKSQSFVSRDPYFLSLQELKTSGGLVTYVMGNVRSKVWAPELRDILSFDSLRQQSKELKRKRRDNGSEDEDEEEQQGQSKSPRLELSEAGDTLAIPEPEAGEASTVVGQETVLEIPADEGPIPHPEEEDVHEPREDSAGPSFNDTAAPLLHPADSGPVSIGTQHAVHILRDLFGADAATDETKRKETSVVFQDLLPEGRTTKTDATKMFFECLVLATKDAIKVEQPEAVLGGPIRVRGKRGLWGSWAEREAGGEMAANQEEDPPAQPEPAIAGPSRTVTAAA